MSPLAWPLVPLLRGRLAVRVLSSHLVLDESTAFALAQPTPELGRRAFYMVGFTVFFFWQTGTAVGALVGGAINPASAGLDAAFPAGLLALLAPRLGTTAAKTTALVAACVALATTPILPAGAPILVAAFGALAGTLVERQ